MTAAKTFRVGEIWTIEKQGNAVIVRPDGTSVRVSAWNGHITHVLDMAGIYQCDEERVTAK